MKRPINMYNILAESFVNIIYKALIDFTSRKDIHSSLSVCLKIIDWSNNFTALLKVNNCFKNYGGQSWQSIMHFASLKKIKLIGDKSRINVCLYVYLFMGWQVGISTYICMSPDRKQGVWFGMFEVCGLVNEKVFLTNRTYNFPNRSPSFRVNCQSLIEHTFISLVLINCSFVCYKISTKQPGSHTDSIRRLKKKYVWFWHLKPNFTVAGSNSLSVELFSLAHQQRVWLCHSFDTK